MSIENKIRANDRSIWMIDQFSQKKGGGIILTMMDARLKIQNPGYEYPLLTGKVLRVETNRGKNKNDGQPELLPVVPTFPIRSSVFSSPEMQPIHLASPRLPKIVIQWFQTSIHYSVLYIQQKTISLIINYPI